MKYQSFCRCLLVRSGRTFFTHVDRSMKMPSSRRTWRSQYPVGFEAVDLNDCKDCPVLEDVSSGNGTNNSSFWLIKVPCDFDVSSLSGKITVLNGTQDLPPSVAQNTGKRYEVHSRTDCSAELSSFSVLLPSMQKKSLCVAGSISGQMSVIQSVPVPPPTLPESSLGHRQIPSQLIKKWKPFGYKKPQQNLSHAKGKKSKGPSRQLQESLEGSQKHKKERKTTRHLEESIEDNKVSSKTKRHSPKKNKDQQEHGVNLTQVKMEPDSDANSQINSTNRKHSSTRKRKTEMNQIHQCDGVEDPMLTPREKRKKRKSEIIVKQEPGETSPQSKKHQDDVSSMGELISVKQEKNKGTPSRNLCQAKEKESKGPNGQLQEGLEGSRKHKKERKTTRHLEESIEDNKVSSKEKRDSPKKKKDKEKHGVELTRVKKEPNFDANSQITAANGEQSSTRKRKTEMNQIHEDPMLTPSEKRKKHKSKITVKQEPDETSPQSKKHQYDVSGMGELISLKQEENKGTSSWNLSRAKEKESKGPSGQLQESLDGSRKHKKERNLTKHLEESIEDNEVSSKKKRDSLKKKKDKEKHGVNLTQVKIEPNFDANSQITATNGEQRSSRKIKTEKNQMQECDDVEDPMFTPREKRKKRKSEIKVKQEPGLKNTKMMIPAWASSFL